MEDREFSPSVISNRRTAIAVHRRLRDAKSPMLELGRFYCSMLDRGIWDSQKSMAAELGVSTAHLNKMIAAARLPQKILALFDGQRLSFRNVSSLSLLIEQFGEAEVCNRANTIPKGTALNAIFAVLTTGKPVPRQGVRVSISADARYLRIDVPNIALVAPRVKELEELLNAMLGNGFRPSR
ncbi:hypothetical protein [Paraburkholderia hospita]|uniref:hypothetical protein n=1 Tax=Paraburkholderia hospita TaxID=169430 RepID=UPI0008A75A8B|nr:hypothetical protein [Paraburkholderia hospita]SEI23707.1 hypothetical protein SAMN05192544_104918 [Paraburkholderia hospita]